MSEELHTPASPAPSGGGGPDVALALQGASRDKADAFLEDQRAMLHLQMEEMRQRNSYDLSHLRLRRFSGWARAALEFSLGLIGLALVGGLGVMVWNAAHAEGYVIESFAVPPDLAARGLTGEVVAGRLLDRLNVVTTPPPNSVASAATLSTSVSDEVRVEIPQTGISLGELYRFLRRWLGHETHVSGEVVRQDNGVAVAVRVNGKDGAIYQGPEADFDALLQKAAEHVYDTVLPVGYGSWLSQTPARAAEMRAVYQRVIADPASASRAQAGSWNGLANMSSAAGDLRQSLLLFRRAREADPNYALGFSNAVNIEVSLSHPEAALALLPQALAVLGTQRYFSKDASSAIRFRLQARQAMLHGDHAGAVAALQPALRLGYQRYNAVTIVALYRARLHDGGAAAWMAEQPQPASFAASNLMPLFATTFQLEAALQHWPRVMALAAEADKIMTQANLNAVGRELATSVQVRPWVALAKAKTGEIAEAQSLIAATPADCNDCLRVRGMIASEAKQWGRADYWFARAAADAPSVPFAQEDWGRSLLERGKPDDAIAQFTLANRKGPKFADALEGWGEALMAKSQSRLALAKFVAAEKYAPNWGRLHLKWGQALAYAGKPDEAKNKFARAAQLDLTPAEKAELARQK